LGLGILRAGAILDLIHFAIALFRQFRADLFFHNQIMLG